MKTRENINTRISQLPDEFKAALSVDCVVFGYDDEDLKVLLIESHVKPYEGQLSLLGDLLQNDEDLKQAAQRVLNQRTALVNVFLEQVKSFSDPQRHPLGRVVTFAYYALIKIDEYNIIDQLDRNLTWVSFKDVGQLAFDHNEILKECYKKLQNQLRERPVGFSLLPKKFSILQLQQLYETVLDEAFDKRNFRRKLHALKILVDIGETQQSVSHRPAKLYSFDQSKLDQKFSIP